MTEHVKISREGGVLELTFNRPEKKNAITGAMYEAMGGAIAKADSDPETKVIVISAVGDAFSAGNDLADFARTAAGGSAAPDAGDVSGPRGAGALLQAMANLEKPIIAAVQGRAVGVGGTMLLHCDLVFIAESAKVTMPFIDLGLVPENASSKLLPERIGHMRAFAVFALGEGIVGKEAVELGIAYKALPADQVRAAALEAAKALTQRSSSALMATKRLMRDPAVLRDVIAREGKLFAEQLRSPEAKAAFAKFLGPKV
jgi:enoyl-CoA hydratase/carnithine racemase